MCARGAHASEIAAKLDRTRQGVKHYIDARVREGEIVVDEAKTAKRRKGERAPVKVYRLASAKPTVGEEAALKSSDARALLLLIFGALSEATPRRPPPTTPTRPAPIQMTILSEGSTRMRGGRAITFY